MSEFVVSIDQGTTSSRCMIFDHSGQSRGSSQLEHTQYYPQPGWVEHDPIEIWQRTQEVIRGAIESSDIKPQDIRAIGVANQRETVVVWDKNSGKPFYKAIVWQDTRTKDICDRLAIDEGQDRFRSQNRTSPGDLFLWPKDRMDSRKYPGSS